MGIAIEGVVAGKIGFASHQNAVPILRKLVISNNTEIGYRDLVVELISGLPFLESKSWRIDHLPAGSSTRIPDRDVKLHAAYLADITESLLSDLTIRVHVDEQLLVEASYPVELLAKNEWGGAQAMPELLAAFCMPNDPSTDRVLKGASEVLRRAGKKDAIDGYAGQSRSRTWELASAVWSSVCSLGISYALPPASFETQGQKIRTPSQILDGGVGTCLDTALLFAAALEQAGLNALIVLTKGHAFVGVWLQPQEFSQLITEDASALRKRIALKELVVFETTLAVQTSAPSFSQAADNAQRQVNDEDFIMALDLRRARMQRIRPMALAISQAPHASAGAGEPAAKVSEALEEAPVLPGFDVEIPIEPETPAGKLQLWQRKLLDLTTRNRLLHVPESAKAIRLICPDPAVLEDQLADGKRIRIVAMPDLEVGGRDSALYEQQNHENLREAYARHALNRGEVLATLEQTKLEAALVDMYRKARSDLDEGGANTLFLAIGFLKWKKAADDPKSYSAPLILLPVRLERKSAVSGVVMTMLDEDPRFNLTLLELLRHDFALSISGLDGELPTDQSGIDVQGIWNAVRRAVRDMPGFEVTQELVLGTFSFAKYLMWKDLTDRSGQLMQSPVVRHLLERKAGGAGLESPGEFPRAELLDSQVEPGKLFTPLPVDSSQLAAVIASANGHNFVLDGPPGTGKSQTIANMIAHNLALGRRVLFVAEKMAALNVVKRRLDEKDIGEFCLELHSSKTSKAEVLKQLERAWDTRDALSLEEWRAEAEHVNALKIKLNDVVGALHKRWPNGLTVHEAMGRVIRDATRRTPRLAWPAGTQHDASQMVRLRDVARRLELNRQAAEQFSGDLDRLRNGDWSNGWQEAMVANVREILAAMDACHSSFTQTLDLTKIPLEKEDYASIPTFLAFARRLPDAHGMDLRFAFSPDVVSRQTATRQGIDLIRQYGSIESSLSIPYAREAVRRFDIETFQQRWEEAARKFWFFASLARKKVARALASAGGVTNVPDAGADLPKLRQMRDILEEIDSLGTGLHGMPGWAGLATNATTVLAAIKLADEIRASLAGLARKPEHLVLLRRAAARLIVDGNELLTPNGLIAGSVSALKTADEQLRRALARFCELSGTVEAKVDLKALRATAQATIKNESRLKAWCDWCRIRDEAAALGLSPLSDAIVEHDTANATVPELFEVAYARWFATGTIDGEPLLRGFVPAVHMSDIEAYRYVSDKLAKLTSRYIRAKLCGLIPDKNEAAKNSGFGVLKHELQKSRRHKPVRQLAMEMGDAMAKLAPCMLMSPLSIAQYLPADHALFDLVIFDEASQIAPWDAIGSIARGRQVVVAGDPRQMPPTSFFNRGAVAGDDDTEEDLESILDECLGAGVPSHRLSWHYRSRHESLIAFSNCSYYDNELTTFPAAETRPSAVEWRQVPGVYAKGKGRNNPIEAKAIVDEIVRRLTDPAFTASGRSIGVITLNSEQQKLVSDLLDQARTEYPEIEPHFQLERPEPVVVKNLETVQGDERDVIILGIGYGPTEPGAKVMSMNFGPLNREGGWRRLNVAVTRARQEMLVFTSFDPSMVDMNRTSARAVHDLRHFIEFAQRGPRALAEAVHGSVGTYDSPFEQYVADGLRAKGWNVVSQIGVSRFRIDLGIIHPDRPGDYLVGVECDGATYHSAATARDRDKVRSAILQGLGWKLLRVWSTEWWVDRDGALDRLHAAIASMLNTSRAEAAIVAEAAKKAMETAAHVEPPQVTSVIVQEPSPETGPAVESGRTESQIIAAAGPIPHPTDHASYAPAGSTYRVADYADLVDQLSPDRFHEPSYDATLAKLIQCILRQEAPIRDTLLVQRVARAHGFQRAGRLIRERVLGIIDRNHHTQADPQQGCFVWLSANDMVDWNGYRVPETPEDVRSIEEIDMHELHSAARSIVHGDRVIEIARGFGIRRVTTQARSRIEYAIETLST